jgi:hydrogenase maturation protein HypF
VKLQNWRFHITGIVQGVGFRPTVYLLAQEHQLSGWVVNTARGVEIEIHGSEEDCAAFTESLRNNPPALSKVDSFAVFPAPLQAYAEFTIRESENRAEDFLPVSPDVAICADCRAELFNPKDRRYRYPFINCTHCGPRFSIVRQIPYDRANTSMAGFPLCPDCAAEYHNPSDRRFHAQPVACPVCGPQIWYEENGARIQSGEQALQAARAALQDGKILAVKGLGGYHLACDAHNALAVQTLRERKHRTGKPFALMAFSLEVVEKYVQLSDQERALLTSPQAPIVLSETTAAGKELAKIAAADQVRLGFMLPYTPLHLLLLEPAPGFPDALVMTSGNLSEEPLAYRDEEAHQRLAPLADAFLTHNRPIHMRVDDSVVTALRGQVYFARRARGYAPGQLHIPPAAQPVLGTGTQLKNTFCLARDQYAFVSHFIGDLENQETLESFEQAVGHYEKLFRIHPEALACDLHPDYLATRYARARSQAESLPLIAVQHHHAHLAACLAENAWESREPAIGLIFDGTGYGTDGSIWGGEILVGGCASFERRFHLLPVRLPGGDLAVRKPARTALSWLTAAGISAEEYKLPPIQALSTEERSVVRAQLESGYNAPLTSSMGRLFDAAASILGLCHEISYEAQAAIALESAADPDEAGAYPFTLQDGIIDPREMLKELVRDLQGGLGVPRIAARFHNSITRLSVQACQLIREETGIFHVAISGGVWQNMRLMRALLPALEAEGFVALYHHALPTNDACVSLGQVMVALQALRES